MKVTINGRRVIGWRKYPWAMFIIGALIAAFAAGSLVVGLPTWGLIFLVTR